MWKKLSLYVCLITILCSCQKQRSAYAPPTFPEVKKIHAHRLSDELLISYPLDMAVSEDYIFILALADNAWLQVYDKTTGQLLGSFEQEGRDRVKRLLRTCAIIMHVKRKFLCMTNLL